MIVVAVHGRDQDPDYLRAHLIEPLERLLAERGAPAPADWVLPVAPDRSWYPGVAADPLDRNEPDLLAALGRLDEIAADLSADDSAVLVGFSQGGCVVAEAMARRPEPWQAAAVLTGTLLGPDPATRTAAPQDGRSIVFATGSDDPWMPPASAEATAAVFTAAGASTTVTITPSAAHEIHPADLGAVADLLEELSP